MTTECGARLERDLVYGPVLSRRYGLVYGVNLLASSSKNCGWNCVYCQLGPTNYRAREHEFAEPDELHARLSELELECIPSALVVCGNGEPTRHPRLSEALGALKEFRDASLPKSSIVVLTNGSELHRQEIRHALQLADEVSVKLDSGNCETFHRMNLPSTPACVHFQARMIRKLHGAVVQSCFLDGAVTNTSQEDIDAWLEALSMAMPVRVDCYTLARPTASRRLHAVPAEWLTNLAWRVVRELGVPTRAFDDAGLIASAS